jgi:glycosyltransferase 2 family protein
LRKIIRVLLQVIVMVAIFAALFWYVGIGSLYTALLNIKIEYLLLAFASYFGINLLFTVRLQRVLKKDGVKTSFGKTLLAQYAGMLTSDVTPGRTGYVLTPLYLRDQNVPASKALSGILGIQTIEFLVKVVGGVGAVFLLVGIVKPNQWLQFGTFLGVNVGFLVMGLGIALMLTGAIILAAITWSQRAMGIFNRIANSKYLKRFTGGLVGKLEEYKDSSQKTRRAVPEIVLLTLACWVLKGFEWLFLALALGLSLGLSPALTWLAFFLIHPLVTALAFIPITPDGMGVQEFGIVGILGLIVIDPAMAGVIGAFAILARGLLIIEDLAGVPQIVKSTSGLAFSRKKPATNPNPTST